KDFGLINKWLRNIKDVYSKHNEELENIEDFDQRFNKLVELNVMEQAKNLAKTTIIQRAWKKRQYPHIHGWVFDLHTGLITQTSEILPGAEVESIYRYDFEEYGEELTQHYNNS
ncbi:MAG: carbonic anhydrase, partial [Runella zeae]